MPTQKKIDQVAELKDILERAAMVVTTQYSGLSVKEQIAMRRALTDGKLEVRVVKNSLLKLAAEQSDHAELMEVVDGPTALAVVYDEIIEAAKALSEYKKSAPSAFGVQGAYLDGSVLSGDDVEALTKIPPTPVLLAQIAGSLQSPLVQLVTLLESPLRELTSLLNSLLNELPGLIDARVRQLEENPELAPAGEAEAEPAAEETPSEEASTEEAPAEEPADAPAEEAPAVEAGSEEAAEPAAEETPEAEASAEEAPAEEAPAAEAAAEEPAAEDATTEEPATEDAPAEEAAEEAAEEEAADPEEESKD